MPQLTVTAEGEWGQSQRGVVVSLCCCPGPLGMVGVTTKHVPWEDESWPLHTSCSGGARAPHGSQGRHGVLAASVAISLQQRASFDPMLGELDVMCGVNHLLHFRSGVAVAGPSVECKKVTPKTSRRHCRYNIKWCGWYPQSKPARQTHTEWTTCVSLCNVQLWMLDGARVRKTCSSQRGREFTPEYLGYQTNDVSSFPGTSPSKTVQALSVRAQVQNLGKT